MRDDELADALVVGAGPAGLVAATYLRRFRRDVRVVDAGDSRAAWIPLSRNLPGFPDGVTGPDLLARLRAQAERYGARVVRGEVARLDPVPGGFTAVLDDGGTIRARRILLATGGMDISPDLPAAREAVRGGWLRQCPICDAYEITGQRVALIGEGTCRVREALLLRSYTNDLTVLTLGRPMDLPADDRAVLRAAGIAIVEEPVNALRVEDERAVVRLASGAEPQFDALYSALGMHIRSGLATAIGAHADDDGALLVDAHQQTSVPGLYAAGDLVRGLSQVSVAAGEAAIAATAINRSLPFSQYEGSS